MNIISSFRDPDLALHESVALRGADVHDEVPGPGVADEATRDLRPLAPPNGLALVGFGQGEVAPALSRLCRGGVGRR